MAAQLVSAPESANMPIDRTGRRNGSGAAAPAATQSAEARLVARLLFITLSIVTFPFDTDSRESGAFTRLGLDGASRIFERPCAHFREIG